MRFNTPMQIIAAGLIILPIAFLLSAGSPASAAPENAVQLPQAGSNGQAIRDQQVQKRHHGKLGPHLGRTAAQARARGISSRSTKGAADLSGPFVRVTDTAQVQVYVHLNKGGTAELAQLRGTGLEVELYREQTLTAQGWSALEDLDRLAALSFVDKITAPRYAAPNAGSTLTEGDAILRADSLRALRLDGSGVRVGVISDGANNRAAAQSSGDLPSGIQVYGSCATRGFNGFSCDPGLTCNEGTAIMEIIHDMAPGAELAVAAASTSLEFIQRVDDLANDFQANIIIDDLGFFGEPFFEDGAIAQAVAAVADDLIYVSSAGNSADGHHESQYRSMGFQDVDVHNFGAASGGSSDATMDLRLRPGEFSVIILQWNDRFGASNNDYDLFLLDSTEQFLLCDGCASEGFQDGVQDPIEGICVFNDTNQNVTGKIVVRRFFGALRRLELFALGGIVTQYNLASGSIFGHPGVPGVLAVGAIDAADPGHNTIEFFSSRGPSRIDFPSVVNRPKPDLAGIDGVSVTGAGGFPTIFFGTSAAAPHVAAVAALLQDKLPAASPTKIRDLLTDGAIDLGSAGFDSTFGHGRVDALNAFELLPPSGLPWLSILLD